MEEARHALMPDTLLETLDLVTKQMTAAVTRCSRDFRYLWVNQAYADWVQRPLDQVIGHPIFEVLGKEAFDALRPYFERVLKGENVQYEQATDFQGIGKRWVSATYTPTLDGNGAIDGWVAVVLDTTERHRTEEARLRHAAIVESYEDAIIAKNLDAVITSWNVGAERIFGYTETEAVGKPITILIPPELRDEENKILEKLRAGGRIEHYETNRVTKTGESVVVSLTIGPLKDSSGKVVGFTKIAHDITQRRRAEEAVKESEIRFRLVADTAPVLIWMSGRDKLCTYFNTPWLDFTGRSMEQELGNGWAEGVHPDDLQRCLDTYQQSFDRREEFKMEYRLRRHDGEYRWLFDIGVPRFNQDHSFAGYIGSCVDVTEHKLAEEALGKNEERFRLAAQAGKMYSYEWDVTTDMLVRSAEYVKILGVTEPLRFTRQQFMDKIHPDDRPRFVAAIAGLTPENPTRDVTYRVLLPGGAFVWLKNSGRAFFDGEGRILRVIGMVADVTDQKLAEEALADMSKKLVEAQEHERARIARELHDDISQRVAMLAIEIELLERRPEAASEIRDTAHEIAERVKELSTDIQALSHELHSSKLEHLGVVRGMKSWCREFGERQGMQIEFKNSGSPSSLPSQTSTCLFRVLQEALHNSAKHSGVKNVDVQLRIEPGEVQLIVHDLGKGFDVAAAMQGRGLGVTSMLERVRLLGGTVTIDSKPRGGTTIYARIPREAHQTQQASL